MGNTHKSGALESSYYSERINAAACRNYPFDYVLTDLSRQNTMATIKVPAYQQLKVFPYAAGIWGVSEKGKACGYVLKTANYHPCMSYPRTLPGLDNINLAAVARRVSKIDRYNNDIPSTEYFVITQHSSLGPLAPADYY